jgi:hypothetical protein
MSVSMAAERSTANGLSHCATNAGTSDTTDRTLLRGVGAWGRGTSHPVSASITLLAASTNECGGQLTSIARGARAC